MSFNRKTGRRGFTLVELLMVIGLMGLLGTISIGGYFAATRGMAKRAMIQDTASLIRGAMQTALIDQVPTAVLFMNRRVGDRNAEDLDGAGIPQGRAVAIKMAGRISYVANNGKTEDGGAVPGGKILMDEFADWNHSYSTAASDKENQPAVRLFRMFSVDDGLQGLNGGLNKCSSLMCAWTGYAEFDTDYMIGAKKTVEEWTKTDSGRLKDNMKRWGLPFHPKNDGIPASKWKAGDGYGVEIASMDLPKNYIFGRNIPSDGKWIAASSPSQGVLVFIPSSLQNSSAYEFNISGNIQISSAVGEESVVHAVIDSQMLKDN